MAAKTTLPGTWVLRFAGFDRGDDHARHITGVGSVTLKETGANKGTVDGEHRATNSPVNGMSTNLRHSVYALSGTYTVSAAGPPIVGEAKITFTLKSGKGVYLMSDTFAIIQSGPDRLWLMSTAPRQQQYEQGKDDPKDLQELVVGDLIKAGADW
jgi:hypothetical protein